jgi:fumarylacetoacetate (FAA) hydrolase
MDSIGQELTRQVIDILLASGPSDNPPLVWKHDQVRLLAPLERPNTVRDFYAFEEHVKHANAIRQTPVPEEWYQFPVFYYSNPESVYGQDAVIPYPNYTKELDFELEAAIVIGKAGRDLRADEAAEYIFGFMIMNDWSARDVQRAEMRARLGPAKSKDFATSFGPWLVTVDELIDKATDRVGIYNLEMISKVNGQELSRGNLSSIYYSFGDMIARASASCTIKPGDVFGSGTVGNGCLLELTNNHGPWLQPGDRVELEIECLGTLSNIIGPS